MRYTLPDLLTRLGVEFAMVSDDADPAALYDPDTCLTTLGEVRIGAEGDQFLSCEIATVTDDHWESVVAMRAEPKDEKWRVVSLAVRGQPVQADADSVVYLMGELMRVLKAGRVPDVAQLLWKVMRVRMPV